MDKNNTNKLVGSLKISESVIEQIAAVAAKEVEGVADLGKPKNDVKKIIEKRGLPTPIIVTVDDGLATIDINVNLEYGANVQKVAKEIQKRVKEMVQNMTEVAVSKVNVRIAGISIDKAEN